MSPENVTMLEISENSSSSSTEDQALILLSGGETESETMTDSACVEYTDLGEVCLSETLLVPLPPTPYFKVQEKFLFDDFMDLPSTGGDIEKAGTPELQPKDRYNLFFIAFMILGAGFHLPFNSFVAAVDYFMTTYNRDNMAFIVASTNSYTTCIAVCINVILVNRISTHTRITFGYVAFIVSLGSMAVLVMLTIAEIADHQTGFYVTIMATILTGIGCGIQEASYYGYAGMLPQKYTRAVMLGEAFAGLVVSVNRIITKLTIDDPLVNTIIFFSLSIVGEIVCICLHRYIKSCDFVHFYKAQERAANMRCATTTSMSPLITKETSSTWTYIKDGITLRWRVTKKIWKLMVGILNVYFVTLVLYPGVTSIIPSTWPNNWFPVVLITVFNFFDFGGTLTTGLKWKMPDNTLLVGGMLRWVLFPLLLLCVLPLGAPIIPGEVLPILIILVLGFTTGYMGSTPMCAASDRVSLEEREMAGNLMTMMMLCGLTFGSSSALLVDYTMGIPAASATVH